jgi:hypothetical protein
MSFPCPIAKEHTAVRAILRHLTSKGWSIVSAGGAPVSTLADAMTYVENLDECRVRVARDGATSLVLFVMGNGVPSEVAADWTVTDPRFVAEIETVIDGLTRREA